MRRFSVFLLLLLATATYVHGQLLEPHSSSVPDAVRPIATIFQSNVMVDGCPVWLSAERRSGLVMDRIDESPQKGPAQGLHITLDHLMTPAIESVEITIHGLTPKLSLLPADAGSKAEVSKTFQVHRNADSKSLHDAYLWMSGVSVLERADLNSITYVDGSTWHESEDSICRAVPSAFMLVGSR